MRSKKINRHLYCQTEFHGKSEKLTFFYLENLHFGPIRVLKKYLLNEFGLRECTKILVFGVDLKKIRKISKKLWEWESQWARDGNPILFSLQQ